MFISRRDFVVSLVDAMSRIALTPNLVSLIVLVGGLVVITASLSFVLLQMLQGYM